ncbi:MAG TPA: PAS domain S-box protein [Gemmatimonadaceae bacterium]|nr:PAS domain S-box protein [Gemmatimonadaceae bacterium]
MIDATTGGGAFGLPGLTIPEQERAALRRFLDEHDLLYVLHEATIEAERATGLERKLRLLAQALTRVGFARVAVAVRDAQLEPTLIVSAGLTPEEERDLRLWPAPGERWRRRLALLERFRIGDSYYLDARDPWVAKEFRDNLPSRMPAAADGAWTPGDALLTLLRGATGHPVGTIVLDDPYEARRPSAERVRAVELFAQRVAQVIDQAQRVELAQRRAERLQRLHEVGSLLARSLDEREILLELARQVGRVLPADGVVIAHPELDDGTVRTSLRLVRGVERTRPPQRLGHGVIAEAARAGRPVRVDDYDAERFALAAADDVVGDGGPAGSVLAAPMMIGIRLVGVLAIYAGDRGAYAPEDEEVLLTMGAQAATALTNARLYADSKRERRQSEALADVARAAGESLRLDDVVRLALRHAMSLIRPAGALVAMREGESLTVIAGAGAADSLAGLGLPVAGTLAGRALRGGSPVVANDVVREPDDFLPDGVAGDPQKALVVPITTADGAIGVIAVLDRDEDFGTSCTRILVRLADHLAVAIAKNQLFEGLAEATREWAVAFDSIVSGMVVLDAGGRITRCNARALQLTGIGSPAALLGRSFHDGVLGEGAPCGQCVHERTLAHGTVGRGTHRLPALGKVFELVASPHPSGGAVVTFDDVTEHLLLEERHRRVVETTNDAIVITDPQRRIAFANPAARALFGRPSLEGVPVRELVEPTQLAEVTDRQTRAFGGEGQRYESVIVRADGERRIVAISTAPLRDVEQITGVVASIRDITDERRARDAAAHTEARYRNLFETAPDAIYTLDSRGAFTSVNQMTCEITGLSRDALLGRSSEQLLDPDELAGIREHFTAALAGELRRYECHFLRRGERRLASVTNTPIRRGQTVVGVLGVARDITDERLRAEALARSEARYSRLVESASDAIFTLDLEGRFTSLNRALEHAIGRPREMMIGVPFLAVVDERDHDATWAVFQQTTAGERKRVEFRFVGGAGDLRTGSIISSPIVEDGVVIGTLGIVRDVTEEKQLTEQLLQQEKLAAVGQLVSGVAHELNNPLAGVMAFSQILLASKSLTSDQQRAATTIHGEAKRAAKIVANLLTFARKHQPERRVTDLNRILLETLDLRKYSLRVQQIELEVDLAPVLPETWADPFQLQQVFLNLITNAEHALSAHAGTRRLRIRTEQEDDRLLLTVSDTGPGIAKGHIDRIFNPFFTTKPVGKGTGLGLSISDGIIREHGGRIRVDSTPGVGATFVIELPITVPPPPPAAEPRPPVPAADAGASRRVLVVDDEQSVRTAICQYLDSIGHHAEGAASGVEALHRIEQATFDAVFLDLRMPEMSGDEVFAALQRRAPELAARTVFITGDTQNEQARAFIRATGRPCISKPFALDDLAHALHAGGGN